MSVKLVFGHAENGSATAKMAFEGKAPADFDYVSLVTYLFDNPSDEVAVELDSTYTSEQSSRLVELVAKIEATAKGRVFGAQDNGPSEACG